MHRRLKSGSSRFQLGEGPSGPSRGLLRDYEHMDGPSSQALPRMQALLPGCYLHCGCDEMRPGDGTRVILPQRSD